MNVPIRRLRGDLDVFDVILGYRDMIFFAELVKLIQFSELVTFAPLRVAVSMIKFSQIFVWN
jgi:hypothetical protein